MGFSRIILLFILSALIVFSRAQVLDDLLEFAPAEGASNEEPIYLTDNNPEVTIDATSKVTRSVYFLGSTPLVTHVVRFSCEVPRRSSPLTDVKLCCGSSAKDLACHRMFSKPNSGKITCNQIQFDYNFDKYQGAVFTLSLNPKADRSFEHNEQIFCEVHDAEATIQSNVVDLRDAAFYANQLGVEPSNKVEIRGADISPRDFPLRFSCGDYADKIRNWPSWMASLWEKYLSPFEWGYCAVGQSTTPAGCAKNRLTLDSGQSVTTMDGTLFLLSTTQLAKNPNSAFVCFKRGSTADPIRVYASDYQMQATPRITKGFTLNESAPPSHIGGFEAISPVSSSYQFVEGTLLSDFKLLAFYRIPESAKPQFKALWFKDGNELIDKEGTAISFQLPNKVERSVAGKYELRVMEGAAQRLKFTYDIEVVGPPTFKDANCIDDLFYALEGSTKKFTCLLNAQESEDVSFMVGINGFEADTAEKLKKLLGSSLQLQNQPIAQLQIDFNSYTSNDLRGMMVEMKNLAVGQNFRLSIKAINAYGQSQVAGTLRVVPKPALEVSPSRQSCSSECGEDPFEVQCVPLASVSKQWSSLNIIPIQGWVLARTFTMTVVMGDPDLSKFFIYNASNPSVLRVSPYAAFADISKTSDLPSTTSLGTTAMTTGSQWYTSSTSTPRESLQEVLSTRLSKSLNTLQLECRFELFVNNTRAKFRVYSFDSSSNGANRRRREVLDDQKRIYDSYNEEDEALKDTLTVSRAFAEVLKPAAASFAWIAAVVIAIIFILIVIIVAVWLCTRNRGETYKLSKKEYKLGNDPLRELKEKETFQAYERPEEPPSLASGMEEPDLEVGSDEDGELEAYNMDPARSKLMHSPRNFNEEASFIGQYSSPSRHSGGFREHHTAV